jgi:hypothetical protein
MYPIHPGYWQPQKAHPRLECRLAGQQQQRKDLEQFSCEAMIEWQRQYLLAGDSAYPISENLITSYWNAEALRQPMKACFNRTPCAADCLH